MRDVVALIVKQSVLLKTHRGAGSGAACRAALPDHDKQDVTIIVVVAVVRRGRREINRPGHIINGHGRIFKITLTRQLNPIHLSALRVEPEPTLRAPQFFRQASDL